MVSLRLKRRVYGAQKDRLLRELASEIAELTSGLDIRIEHLSCSSRGHVTLDVTGEDCEFASNLLYDEYGRVPVMAELTHGQELWGSLVDVCRVGYGLYSDIGVSTTRPVDVLIPLHTLREQAQMHTQSLRAIAKALVLVEHLPVNVTIKDVNLSTEKIEGALTDSFLRRVNAWTNDDHERLLVFGANKATLERAIAKSGHLSDVYQVETLGPYEFSLVCKRSTRASGIVSSIGPMLTGVPIHLFIPRELNALREMN
ncbi:MAG: DUF2110 family protein [Candidatus Thorarchaeota archaeon]|nr:DUF2110 family protein [Candidatus Thorarchaeota archaeon]